MQDRHFNNNRQPREYRPPAIETKNKLTYGVRGSLAIVYGINVPFITRMAKDVFDQDGFYLWSSPTLVLTLAEAADAHRNNDRERNDGLIRAAVEYCNQYLPEDSKLRDDAVLRLSWARYGVACITCEENRSKGYLMDVLKHGPETMVLIAPLEHDQAPIQSNIDDSENEDGTETIFFPTGEAVPQRNNSRNDERRNRGRGDGRRRY